MNAPELLRAYLSKTHDPAAVAALFAEDGVLQLPQMKVRVQGARGNREIHRRAAENRWRRSTDHLTDVDTGRLRPFTFRRFSLRERPRLTG